MLSLNTDISSLLEIINKEEHGTHRTKKKTGNTRARAKNPCLPCQKFIIITVVGQKKDK